MHGLTIREIDNMHNSTELPYFLNSSSHGKFVDVENMKEHHLNILDTEFVFAVKAENISTQIELAKRNILRTLANLLAKFYLKISGLQ